MKNIVDEGKGTAIMAYILIVGVLIALSMNSESKNPYASFHIRQALGLSVMFVSLGLIVSPFNNPAITFSIWAAVSVLWTYGFFSAVKGSTNALPLFGAFFQKFFKSIS